jgi:hypothetical protein
MANSLGKNNSFFGGEAVDGQPEGISPYKKVKSFKAKSEIITFDLLGDKIYMAVNQAVLIYDMEGTLVKQIPASGKEIRDIKVEDERIYLLYPSEIEVFTLEGERFAGWSARRNSSDYCSIVLSSEYIFVTDAGNKNICRYTREGDFLDFILSPNSFIIPSYAFDIINIQDTLYCSNSGRNRVERYTLEGKYLGSFGKAGSEAGSFAGCCNPTFLAATQYGDIITSEKGSPRISCYDREGTFKDILLGSRMLGGGTKAYSVKVQDDRIYVAGKNTLTVFVSEVGEIG